MNQNSPQLHGRLPRFQYLLRRLRRPVWLGTLRRTTPVSGVWGKDRGTPVDRYYIEQFLQSCCHHIRGNVLEVGGRVYTDQFGMGVEHSDILDNNPANALATIQADLETLNELHSNEYDCLIFTQVLQFIYNLQHCVQGLYRMLRPGGILLVTLPCISRIDPSYGMDKDYWRFTASGCRTLFGNVFGKRQVDVQAYGNVLSSIAFLSGLACEELSRKELDTLDPLFQLLISVRAVKQS